MIKKIAALLLALAILLPAGIRAGGLAALQQAEREMKEKANRAKEEASKASENDKEKEQVNEEGESE